ncbi:outer membrane protein assembly factor [Prolixibacteraceae bacterium JC049]|nr:outer membrane protein assembly factor [Prolixibacteraceae bacterium JC049]
MQKLNRYRRLSLAIAVMAIVLMFSSCRSTRFVPEGKYLVDDVEIKLDTKEIKQIDLNRFIRQKPNAKILGIARVKLGLYNLSSKKKENDWLKRMGEEPVIYEDYYTERTVKNLKSYFQNKGFYQVQITDTVIKHRKGKKLDVIYNIKAGKPYLIRNIDYDIADARIDSIMRKHKLSDENKQGKRFDIESLKDECENLSRDIRDSGFYNFGPDMISVSADSAFAGNVVDFKWRVKELLDNNGKAIPYRKARIKNVTLFTDFKRGEQVNNGSLDSILYDGVKLFYKKKLRVKPDVLTNAIFLKNDELFSQKNVERTYNSLAAIRQYRFVNILFENANELDSLGNELLNCKIQLSPLTRQNYSVNLEWTNSSGDMGVGGTLQYGHKNLFGGAEIFNVNLKGGVEKKSTTVNDETTAFNTNEIGVDASLTIPKFFAPYVKLKSFKYTTPNTTMSLSYNFQKRPDYTRTIAAARFGYKWRSSRFIQHRINLLDFNVVNLPKVNENFLNQIRDLNIRNSYIDHLISATNYSYTYNTQISPQMRSYSYFRFGVESAGNILSAASNILGSSKKKVSGVSDENAYHLFKTPFSQYLKADIEFRHGYVLDKTNTIVVRAFAGIGVPYGNSSVLPFEKRYFTGGANGIRAWSIRSLGPGNYKAGADDYPNQTGDIKLETNVEYRFKMFWKLEGALFLDAGNIWTIDDEYNGVAGNESVQTAFKLDKFMNQIAVGSGMGVRVNLSYFVFRLDWGLKLRDPALPRGERWIPANRKFTKDDYNFSFAIGYPF